MRHHVKMTALALFVLLGPAVLAACGDSELVGPQPDAVFEQVDRIGFPAVNTVFIPSGMKDEYNAAPPAEDPERFRDEIVATLMSFGQDQSTAENLAATLTPDVMPVDVTRASGFPNGRRLQDDVITGELMLIFGDNQDLNDDHVDANDKEFSSTFPFLAPPH